MVWEPCSMARQNCHLKFTGLSQPQPCVQQLPVPTNPAGTLKLHTPVTGCLWLQITPRVLQAGAPTMGVACFIQRQKHKSEVSFISCLINHLLWGKKKKKMVVFSESHFYSVSGTYPPFLLPCSSIFSLPPTNCSGQR